MSAPVDELEFIRTAAVAAASAVLSQVDATNYRSVFTRDGRILTAALIGSRYRAKAIAEAAMTETIVRATGTVVSPVVVPYDAVKYTRSGVDTGALLARTPGVIEARIAAGVDPEIAVQQGVNLARSLVSSEAFRVDRAAVEEATATDPRFVGWVRVTEAGACDFCEMLASRGAVYTSDTTALGALDYHNNCNCYAEEVVDPNVARAIKRDGEAAWAAQVEAGRVPTIYGQGSKGSATGVGDTVSSLSRERALDVLSKRIAFYEEMAGERSNIPGRQNYALSSAERARRERERLLRNL